jgi:hypothetical protein
MMIVVEALAAVDVSFDVAGRVADGSVRADGGRE